jgi:Tfp pilus assembly protein PilO
MSAPAARPFWRRRLLVPFLALAVVDAALFGALTLPRLLRERSVAARAETLRGEVTRLREWVAKLEGRAAAIEANRRDSEAFYANVLGTSRARLVPVLRELSEIAAELGLAAGSATYAPQDVRDAPLVRYQITMPLKGSYEQLVSFLGKLERSKQFLIVDQLSLRERGGEDASGQAELSVVLSTYFRAGAGGGARGR